jgi:hypothetical protein
MLPHCAPAARSLRPSSPDEAAGGDVGGDGDGAAAALRRLRGEASFLLFFLCAALSEAFWAASHIAGCTATVSLVWPGSLFVATSGSGSGSGSMTIVGYGDGPDESDRLLLLAAT